VNVITGVTLPQYTTVFLTDSLRILGQAHPTFFTVRETSEKYRPYGGDMKFNTQNAK
jgi:hypothetical protein